jgi:hypothetical protein
VWWIALIVLVVLGKLEGILALMQLRIAENLQQKYYSSFGICGTLPKIKFGRILQYLSA